MSEGAFDPSPRFESPGHQIAWVMQRIAASSGRTLDRLQLHQALLKFDKTQSPEEQAQWMCQQLGWPKPHVESALDPAHLPAMVHDKEHGWLLVVAQNADKTWRAHTPNGSLGIDSPIGGARLCMRFVLPAAAVTRSPVREVIRRVFGQYQTVLADGVLATVMVNVLALLVSFFSMQVYDRVIPTQGLNTLLVLGVGVVMAILFEFALKVVRSRVMEYAVVGMDSKLSRSIFERLLSVRLDQLPQSVGTLAGQLRAYEVIRAFFTAGTVYVLVDVPFSLIFVVVIGLLGTPVLLVIPFVFLVLSVLTGLLMRRTIDAAARTSVKDGSLKTGLLVEAVEGAETIKAGQGGWRFLSRWMEVTSRAVESDLRVRHASEFGGYCITLFQQLCYAALVSFGAWLVIDGQMTTGALIACTILSSRALSPIGMLPGLIAQFAQARAALAGLENVYALEADNSGVNRPLLPEVLHGHYILDHVVYRYKGEVAEVVGSNVAISVPRLEIKSGDKVGVLGPVGSGKSTLIRLLSGLYYPEEGRILLDGLDISHISRQRVAEQVGYLQQEHRLFAGTLRDNLLIGLPDPGDDTLYQAARRSGLLEMISSHPLGLERPIMEGGKGLSGGQRQLVAFTRIILTQPRIWLLDEPTANMDEELERRCLAVLKEDLTSDRTAVIVTHKPSILPLVTHLIVVAKNRVLFMGTRDEVLQRLKSVSTLLA